MVSFWIVCGCMSLAVVALLLRAWSGAVAGAAPVPADAEAGATQDVALYRAQLAEVDRDLARGLIPEDEAERVRLEVSRRLLAADARSDGPVRRTAPPLAVRLGVGGVVIMAALALYWQIGAPGYGDLALQDRIDFAQERLRDRPSQAAAEAQMPPGPAPAASEYTQLVAQLRATVAERPDDLQGHVLLARSEANLGNYARAAVAQGKVIDLKGDAATPQDLVDHAELLIFAAGGYVSPEAERVLRQIIASDPANGAARYYRGLLMSQIGRPDLAFREWDSLLRQGPPEAAWIDPIVAQIPAVAQMAGVRYDLPEIGTGVGPSQDDVAAAQDMTPAERMEMIEGMVAGLSDRLATTGGSADEWARLISALGVLRRVDQAQAVYDNALEVFAEDKTAIDLINRAGDRAGVVMP